ncbi:MAG: hypothetical protein KUG61_05800 [Parvibaculaceae bacterium]|nr:hypothetical protein [Parvibaculaceae bacterium]
MSNSSDDVHERPAWLLPVIVGITVLIFSGFFLYYYFGPTTGEILGTDPKASASTEMIDTTIGDLSFTVPINYTRIPAQRRGGQQKEIAFHALLMDLTPFTPEQKHLFDSNEADARVVHFRIHERGKTLPATRRLDSIYVRYFESATQATAENPLEHYTFVDSSGYRDQDLFVFWPQAGEPLLLMCFRETGVIANPSCSRTLSLSDGTMLTYRYKRPYQKNWREIDEMLVALIHSWEPKADKSTPQMGGLDATADDLETDSLENTGILTTAPQ